MTEQLLHGPDVVAGFQDMGRERVAQSMARGALGDAGSTYGFLHGSLDGGRVNVMAPPFGARLMGVGPRRRKHPLPRPLGGRTGRLALERVRQLDPPGPGGDLARVARSAARQ